MDGKSTHLMRVVHVKKFMTNAYKSLGSVQVNHFVCGAKKGVGHPPSEVRRAQSQRCDMFGITLCAASVWLLTHTCTRGGLPVLLDTRAYDQTLMIIRSLVISCHDDEFCC